MGLDIVLIIHPRGDDVHGHALRGVADTLRGQGHRVSPRVTFRPGDAVLLARAASRARTDLIIAAGGDGTINEVVNGIAALRWQPRLAIIPVGTANDFAAGLGLPTDPEQAARTAVWGRPVAVDVARVNRRWFVNVSTGGFGAQATESASPETKRLLGPWAYVVTGVKKFAELRAVRARFHTDAGLFYDGECLLFAVGNARQTGGGTLLTPRAEFGDGKLDVLIVPAMPRLDFLALLPDLRAGTHLRSPDVRYVQTPTLEVESTRVLSVNADGEPMRGRRFRYSLGARPLTVMVP